MTSRIPLGEQLVEQGRLDRYQLQSALAHQRRWGGRIGEAIAALGFLPESEVLAAVGRQLAVPAAHIGDRKVAAPVLRLLPEKLVRSRKLFPLGVMSNGRRDVLVVATSEPQDLFALDEAAFASGLAVKPVLAGGRDVERAIEQHYGKGQPGPRDLPAALTAAPASTPPGAVAPVLH